MSPTETLKYRNMEEFGFGPNVMKKYKVCPKCGNMVDAKNETCFACGEKLSIKTLFDQYKRMHASCPDCDTILASDSLYCPNCGRQILPKVAGDEKGGG